MTTQGESAVLVEILNKVSETNITVARLETNLVNLVGRIDLHEKDIRALREDIGGLKSAVQKLDLDAKANAATVLVTAAALKEAEEARRDKSEQSWTPLNRIYLLIGIVTALIATYYAAKH